MSTIPQLFLAYDSAASLTDVAPWNMKSMLVGFAVPLLAHFSDHPVKIHVDSLRRLARYLRMTKDWGLIYWRPASIATLPLGNFVVLLSDPSLPIFPQPQLSTSLPGYVVAAHATDLSTRRSITSLAFILCGGPMRTS
jgi:hypothetical protein